MRACLLLIITLAACSATSSVPTEARLQEETPAAERPRYQLDVLVFERRTRFTSDRTIRDEWRVEARVQDCRDSETLKGLTRSGDQNFTLVADDGEETRLRGGVGGRVGDWGDDRGPQAFLMLTPSPRDWSPRFGVVYRLKPRNEGGQHDWTVAESATLSM
jgi:hypothetical protein